MKGIRKAIALTLAAALWISGSCLPMALALEETPETAQTLSSEESLPGDALPPETPGEDADAAEETGTETTDAPEAPEVPEPTQAPDAAQPPETTPATIPQETQAPPQEEAFRPIEVPLYSQEDYSDISFGGGTLAENGSAVVALAMAASWLTGFDYTPDGLAGYLTGWADNDAVLITQGAALLELPCRKTSDFQEVCQALEGGALVISRMNSQSVFTGRCHMILLTGITPEGRICVSDPSRENRNKAALTEGFSQGFPQGWISTGWEEAWIFDPGQVPEDVSFLSRPQSTQQGMPLYNQMDYPNVRYGSGTIASSGCGITALAMVATCMTGHTYYPDQLADYFGGYNASNVDRLLYASDQLQLPWHKVENWHKALAELKEGKLAIILVNGRSSFTDGQHFLVATGVTEEGRVWIQDPYGPNYQNPELREGFAHGFTSQQIALGYCGGWIYDMSEMPETPFIYTEPERPYVEPRYGELTLTAGEMDLLARMVWVEARGESDEGQQAVAEVVLNRVFSDQFPNTVRSVVYAENQFRGTKFLEDAEPTQTQYEAVENALYGPYVLPIDVTHFATYPVSKNVWGSIGGHIFCYQWEPEE